MKQKLDIIEEEKDKLISEKLSLSEQLEKDLGSTKNRSNELEQEKMQQMNVKNKEIDKLKSQITSLTNQLKSNNI